MGTLPLELVRKPLKNSRGQSLVQVLVSIAIMSAMLMAFTDMTTNQSRESKALSDKLAASDLQKALLSSFADGSVCPYIVNNPAALTFNSNAVSSTNPQIITPSLPIYASVQPSLGPIVAKVGQLASPYSSTVKIQKIELVINQAPAGGPSNGPGDTYGGYWKVTLDPSTLVRAIASPAIAMTLTVDTSVPGNAKVTACQSNGNGCWIEGPGGLSENPACGNVGIGTSTPRHNLHIDQSSGHATMRLSASVSGGFNTGVQLYDRTTNTGFTLTRDGVGGTGNFVLNWDGAEDMETNRIITATSTGNVGFGTPSPGSALSVYSTTSTPVISITANNTPGTNWPGFQVVDYNNTLPPAAAFWRARGKQGSEVAVQANDRLGAVAAFGWSGTTFDASAGVGAPVGINFNADANFIGTSTPTSISFHTANVNQVSGREVMRISSNGNVGIGTSTPTNTLDIKTPTGQNANMRLVSDTPPPNGGTSMGLAVFSSDNSSWPTIGFFRAEGSVATPASLKAGDRLADIGAFGWAGSGFVPPGMTRGPVSMSFLAEGDFTSASTPTYMMFSTTPKNTVNGVERLRITSDGNVGIGTTTPAAKLHVEQGMVWDTIDNNWGGFAGATFSNVGAHHTTFMGLKGSGSEAAYGYPRNGDYLSSFEGRDVIDAKKFPGMGGGAIVFQATQDFDVSNKGTMINFVVTQNGTNTPTVRAVIDNAGNLGVGTLTPGFKIDVQGGSVNSSGGYTQISDIRLKTNVEYLNSKDALDKIASLNGIYFDWKDQAKFGKDHQVGLIAQDVQKAFPEAVKSNAEGFLSVSYSNLVAPIIEAIKELFKSFNELSREVAAIKAESAAKDLRIEKLEQENVAMKAYLCGKDSSPAFCR